MAWIVSGSPHEVWMPVWGNGTTGDTLYVGQIVQNGIDGVKPLGAASGMSNITNHEGTPSTGSGVPLGVVVSTSYETPLYNSTYKTNSIVGVYSTFANYTRQNAGVEGQWGKGDKAPFVKVALLSPTTIVGMRLYNSTFGTAPSVETVTVAGSTGLGCTTGTIDFTPVSGNNTFYFRSGANQGCYRISDQTSQTAHAWDTPTNAAIAVGDTLVAVNVRSHGLSRVQFDTESIFIDTSDALTTNCFNIIVTRMDLSVAGEEYCHFMFCSDNFLTDYIIA